jgi:hypothetical protein
MSNSTAAPPLVKREHVTARMLPLWAAHPMVLNPSVPPPQEPVPFELGPPPV